MFVFVPHRGRSNVLVAQRIRSISILRCTGPLVPVIEKYMGFMLS